MSSGRLRLIAGLLLSLLLHGALLWQGLAPDIARPVSYTHLTLPTKA